MLSNLKLAYNLILIRLSDTTTSGTFELEKKEYQRKNIGIIEKISDDYNPREYPFALEIGDKIIFDENSAIDFEYQGTKYCIANLYDTKGVIK